MIVSNTAERRRVWKGPDSLCCPSSGEREGTERASLVRDDKGKGDVRQRLCFGCVGRVEGRAERMRWDGRGGLTDRDRLSVVPHLAAR